MKLTFSLVILFLSLCSFAGLISEKDCQFFYDDPYETFSRVPKGKYKGVCLDLEKRRNLKRVTNNQDSLVIANFLHEGKYWKASIPNGNIFKRVILQVEFFPPEWIAAHTQMRFDLKEGKQITLEGQNETNKGEILHLSSLIISFEALKSIKGEKYSLFRGLMDRYALSARMFSLKTAYNHIVIKKKHKNQQLLLSFNDKQVRTLFDYYVDRANRNSNHKEMYNTLKNNCTTEIYDGLQFVRRMPKLTLDIFGKEIPLIRKKHFLSFLPVTARKHLVKREILKDILLPLEKEVLPF
ncbi:DUF4105 domain-containing protein [Halobacteriovorax sp. GB3]|uniref:lipoprotein N-acyltransferase Lnb domain-containing protein n=1 Tax=Halobacteriovorax sp. GB3 TaxID=2719615 RepID=UPI0023608399|nr:DUF4105 domain-containing protein [Halobacteriovorax sp. GB3]MDD0854405.1 DUF4105 domain-containing protein [Halobacteriovorax sp. GB3]